MARRFAPVAGELRPGGRLRIGGVAWKTVLACEPASRLALTRECAGETGWVDLDLPPRKPGRDVASAKRAPPGLQSCGQDR